LYNGMLRTYVLLAVESQFRTLHGSSKQTLAKAQDYLGLG